MHAAFKLLDPNRCEFAENKVDVWEYSLTEEWPIFYKWLDEEEQTRANRYYFAKHQRRFRVGRGILKLILSRYLQVSPQAITFTYNKQGKPRLKSFPHVMFNLSHSGEKALLAIGTKHPVGIDIEYFSGRSFVGIAKQLFSLREIQQLQAVPHSLQALSFFSIWTQKEAFIKICGLGLSYPTASFSVNILPTQRYLLHDDLHNEARHMLTFMPSVNCCAALCITPSIQNLFFGQLTPAIIANWMGEDE